MPRLSVELYDAVNNEKVRSVQKKVIGRPLIANISELLILDITINALSITSIPYHCLKPIADELIQAYTTAITSSR